MTGAISDADIRHAFDQTKRFDMVIVAAIGFEPQSGHAAFLPAWSTTSFWLPAADERSAGAVEQFVARLGPDARKIRGAILTGAGAA